jgi:two-component system LytT family sensor kinase
MNMSLHEMVVGWRLKLRQGGWSMMWLITLFWVMMAVISSFQTYYYFSTMASSPPAYRAVFLASLFSLFWAAVTPLVFLLARLFPIERSSIFIHLPLHIFFSLMVGISVRLVFLLSQMVIPQIRPLRPITFEIMLQDIVTSFDYQAMVYWVMLAIHQGALYYRKYQEGRLLAVQLEAQLAQAQLSGLRMQLQPHFLFNTLHVINSLMYESKDRASEMIVRLSEFLRLSLDNTGEQEVSLSREIDFIERYLEIERVRFEERLEVDYELDTKALDCLVPNLLLQPLVENAIKHGISKLTAGGRLLIGANLRNQSLFIFVANSGPLLSSDPLRAQEDGSQQRRGIGLANTSARLRALYGEAHCFELLNWTHGGVEARITIPVRFEKPQLAPPSAEPEENLTHESTHRR